MWSVKLGPEPTVDEDVELNLVSLGAYTYIRSHSILNEVTVGDFSYCDGYNQIDYTTIGKFCSIASFVRINPGNHPSFLRAAQHHFTYRSSCYGMGGDDEDFFQWRRDRHVAIGNDVWIGHSASIMAGVTIGDGAAVGAGSVVTKDVEPYAVVAGVPARTIRMRFPPDLVRRLEAAAWWDWDYETIRARVADFRDLDRFISKYL
jgi:phosphonate metabolism protein (transferase hexapeptide repeat family)